MKVLVCGGRDYNDQARVFQELDAIHAVTPITDVIHGAARGTDMLAHEWANQRRVRMWPYPADWKVHGKAAGPIRNQQMLEERKPDLVVAFPGGVGTDDMVKRALKAGLTVARIGERTVTYVCLNGPARIPRS